MREEFKITRQGKLYVLYAGLLEEAHEKGLRSIDTNLLQVPTADNGNVAVVKAVVEDEDGRSFSGIGDASPENVGRNIVPHIIRMSETRAKARALRDMCNIGATALEELSDGEESSTRTGSQERSQGQEGASPTPILQGRQGRSGDDEKPQWGSRGSSKPARKGQQDLLCGLAKELRGENGVERLEMRIGKPIDELTSAEADEWIDRLSVSGEQG